MLDEDIEKEKVIQDGLRQMMRSKPSENTGGGTPAVEQGMSSSQEIFDSSSIPLQSQPLAAQPHVVNVFERRDRPVAAAAHPMQEENRSTAVHPNPSSSDASAAEAAVSLAMPHPSVVVTPFSHIDDHLHHHHHGSHHHHSLHPDQTQQQPQPSALLPVSTLSSASPAAQKRPVKAFNLPPLRTEGSDFDLSLDAESFRAKGRGLGFWGWLTGADVPNSVL